MPWGILRQKKSVEANSIPNGLVVVCLSLAVAKRQGTAAQDSRIKTCSLGWNREFFSDILRGFSKGNEIRCLDLRVKVNLQHSSICTFLSFLNVSRYRLILIPCYIWSKLKKNCPFGYSARNSKWFWTNLYIFQSISPIN